MEKKTIMKFTLEDIKELIERKHNVTIKKLTLSQRGGAKCVL